MKKKHAIKWKFWKKNKILKVNVKGHYDLSEVFLWNIQVKQTYFCLTFVYR